MRHFKLSKTIAIMMILHGLFFISNIYVFGNHEAAIAMHDDVSPNAGYLITMAKVLNCFIVGVCYFTAGIGILRKKTRIALFGLWGSLFFLALYIVELILWGSTHTRVWFDFSIFGGISMVYGFYSYKYWKNNTMKAVSLKTNGAV